MKRAAILLILIALGVSGCGTLTEQSARTHDHLVGWYKLPARHYKTREIMPEPGTLIPVFKIDEAYYSVCRGYEIPLRECPEGLAWAFLPSSMKGTKIGLDERSKEPYMIIEDARAQYEGDYSTSGEKQFMTKIDKPSWLPDTTSKPRRTNDDFLGWYQPVWFPFVRWEIRKHGERYISAEQELNEQGIWKARVEPHEITPLPDRLGFTGFDRKRRNSLTYNEALKRFELTKTGSCVIRMPLARVSPSPSSEGGAVPPPMGIGIPSWH